MIPGLVHVFYLVLLVLDFVSCPRFSELRSDFKDFGYNDFTNFMFIYLNIVSVSDHFSAVSHLFIHKLFIAITASANSIPAHHASLHWSM